MDLDGLKLIAPGFLKRNRAPIDALQAKLSPTLSAQEVWESAAPVGWVGATGRRFFGPSEDFPPARSAVLALCADPEGVLRAEALGREVAQRLSVFGGATPEVVTWAFWPATLWSRGQLPEQVPIPTFAPVVALVSPHSTEEYKSVGKQLVSGGLPDWLGYAVTMALSWDRAVAAEAELAGRSSPFEPLVELAAAGVILNRIDDATISLIMPAA
jgi:hypothetical protein